MVNDSSWAEEISVFTWWTMQVKHLQCWNENLNALFAQASLTDEF